MLELKSIVLLGYRNAGKDSVCRYLQEHFEQQFYNAKFGAYNKSIAAQLMRVPVSFMEDKEWRNQPLIDDITALDILNSLFYLSEHSTALQNKIHNTCLSNIPDNLIPVFTDVRRQTELNKVLEKFGKDHTAVFLLYNENAVFSKGDEELDEVIDTCTILKTLTSDVSLSAEQIIEILDLDRLCKARAKPVLHLYTDQYYYRVSSLPGYEPLSLMYEKCLNFAKALGLDNVYVSRLFQYVVSEVDKSNLQLADVTEDSKMFYTYANHAHLISMLREKAVLRIHCSKLSSIKSIVQDYFTKQEIVTYE